MTEPWKQSGKPVDVRTPEEWAAEAGGGPWRCPQCGGTEWHVIDTREQADGNIARTRCCNQCKKTGPRLYTKETVYRTAPPTDDQIIAARRRG